MSSKAPRLFILLRSVVDWLGDLFLQVLLNIEIISHFLVQSRRDSMQYP